MKWFKTPDRTLLLRDDGVLVRRRPDLVGQEPSEDELLDALVEGFGLGVDTLTRARVADASAPWSITQTQFQQYERIRKVFEKVPVVHVFSEFAFAVADLFGLTPSHDPMLAELQAIDQMLHGYFTQVDHQIYASWSATRLAMLADVHAHTSGAIETISSIVQNAEDLTSPLTVARLAHADRDSLFACNVFTSGIDSGYWRRPFSKQAAGIDRWGTKFQDRAPVGADGTVWDPRLALPALLYAVAGRVLVLKAIHDDPRRYCAELNRYTQFLLSVQLRWQDGLCHKYELTAHEKLFGAGFTVVPFAAGAVDVYTGNTHHIDVDVDALNLSYALGHWGGPLPPAVPYLHPDDVCQDIVDDEVDMRYENECRNILSKQTEFSFTKLRWRSGIQALSDTVKSLGEICAVPSNSSPIVDHYRRGLRSLRQRYGVMPPVDEDAQSRGQLAMALTDVQHHSRTGNRRRAAADRFELYCALRENEGIKQDLRGVLDRRLRPIQ